MSLNPLTMLMIGSSVICLFLSAYAWKRRHLPTALAMSLLMAAVAVWSFFYGLELAVTDSLSLMWVALGLAHVGIVTIPVLWFIFSCRYSGNDQWLKPSRIVLLFIMPAISVAMLATNDMHHFFYAGAEIGRFAGITYLSLDTGPFWWIFIAYSYLWVVAGLAVMLRMLFKVAGAYRFRIGCLLAGALLPFVVNVAYVTGFELYGFLNLTPAAFAVMGIIYVSGVYTVDLFDINPVAVDLLLDSIPDAVLVLDTNANLVSVNPTARALLKSRPIQDAISTGRAEAAGAPGGFLRTNTDGTDVAIGDRTYYRTTTELLSGGGRFLGTIVVMRDVTERKQAEEVLRETGERFRSLFEQSLDAIYMGTSDGTVIDVNQAWLDLFGYTRADLASINAIDLYVNPDDRDGFLRRLIETGVVEDEVRFKRKDGSEFDCQRSVVAQRDTRDNVFAIQGVLRDITEEKSNRAELERLARFDTLTCLMNRHAVVEKLTAWIRHSARYRESLSVALVDLDYFKQVNDTHGHAVGDRALAYVASLLQSSVREVDEIGRYGGEEFLVILPHTNAEGAAVSAERIRSAVAHTPANGGAGVKIPITVCIGVAEWYEGETVVQLLSRADATLYRAKSAGRNRVAVPGGPEDSGR